MERPVPIRLDLKERKMLLYMQCEGSPSLPIVLMMYTFILSGPRASTEGLKDR